ncbi:hypothetical protein T09_14645 [Trichinella sp. T9]|nr:hypothetical protein T09_14645 [Trichinella sp. T9]
MVYEVLQRRSNAMRLNISTTKASYSSVKLHAEKKMGKPNLLDVLALRPNDYYPICFSVYSSDQEAHTAFLFNTIFNFKMLQTHKYHINITIT